MQGYLSKVNLEFFYFLFKYTLSFQTAQKAISGCKTGVTRNFDWKGPNMEKSCDVNLLTFLGDGVTKKTS